MLKKFECKNCGSPIQFVYDKQIGIDPTEDILGINISIVYGTDELIYKCDECLIPVDIEKRVKELEVERCKC